MVLKDKTYEALKWIMLLATPVATFILGVYSACQSGDVATIITAVIGGLGTLAGVIIKVSDTNYRKEGEGE